MSEDLTSNEEAAKQLFEESAPKRAPRAKAAPATDGTLSNAEINAAKAEARERVNAAMREAERERVIAQEMEAIKREEGQRTGRADMDEPVKIHVDLAEFSDRLVINGTEYFHGYTYTVPRHVANSMREMMQRTHRHQHEIEGKSLEESYRRTSPKAFSAVTGGAVNVPEGV